APPGRDFPDSRLRRDLAWYRRICPWSRKWTGQRTLLLCFCLDVTTELGQCRVTVDLDGLDRRLILLVDSADPGYAADRIEAEVDELGIVVDVALLHLKLACEERPEGGHDRWQN